MSITNITNIVSPSTKPLTSHKLLVLKVLIPIKVPIYKVEVAFTLDTLRSFMGSL